MLKCSEMPYHIAIELVIFPNYEQKRIISKNDGAGRFIYNRLVALNNERYMLSKAKIYSQPVQRRLDYLNTVLSTGKELANTIPFLEDKDIDSLILANERRFYQTAWNNFKKNPDSGVPAFHKKSNELHYQTNAQYPKGAAALNDGNVHFVWADHKQKPSFITLPKIGKIRFKTSPKMLERILGHMEDTRIGSVTIHRDACGRYSATLSLSSTKPFVEQLPPAGSNIGIDMNLSNFCTDSDGRVIENPHLHKNLLHKIKKAQKKFSRRMKADIIGYRVVGKKRYPIYRKPLNKCKNLQKARVKLARLERQAARQRKDFLNVQSTDYIKNHDMIFTEDLKIKSMMKNHHMAGSIADVSWSMFFTMLALKASMYGKQYYKVPARNTTQTCSHCGYAMTGAQYIQLGTDDWVCPVCGTLHIRDHNAAINILSKGMAMLAAGKFED